MPPECRGGWASRHGADVLSGDPFDLRMASRNEALVYDAIIALGLQSMALKKRIRMRGHPKLSSKGDNLWGIMLRKIDLIADAI